MLALLRVGNDREESVNEIRILASVRHPNIIRFREAFIENDTLFIVCQPHSTDTTAHTKVPQNAAAATNVPAHTQVTDFANKTDVSQVIEQHKKRNTFLSENTIWSIFIQVVMGLQYLHRHNILHRVCRSHPHLFSQLFNTLATGGVP